MHFNKRDSDTRERVTQGHARVGVTGWVDDDELDSLGFCPMHPVNELTLDVALEALKLCRARRGFQLPKLLRYAKLCRVERVMRPYLEALS